MSYVNDIYSCIYLRTVNKFGQSLREVNIKAREVVDETLLGGYRGLGHLLDV